MAGQSNMAGRGLIEAQDTITNKQIFAIDELGELILAKEPIHFYQPTLSGLDCGLSFGNVIIKNTPANINVLLIPTAIGGSSIEQWIQDETHRNVKLLSNFKEKVELGKKYGEIKAILWHQGESNANSTGILGYNNNLEILLSTFRNIIDNQSLPILIGELGSFSNNNEHYWQTINSIINEYSNYDIYSRVILTSDLEDKGDKIHFNSSGQRKMGERFAVEYLNLEK